MAKAKSFNFISETRARTFSDNLYFHSNKARWYARENMWNIVWNKTLRMKL